MVHCKNSPESTWKPDRAIDVTPSRAALQAGALASSRTSPPHQPCCQHWLPVQAPHPKNSKGDPGDGNACCASRRQRFPLWTGTDPVLSDVPNILTTCTTVTKNPLANLTNQPIPSSYLLSPLPLHPSNVWKCYHKYVDGRVVRCAAPPRCIDQEPVAPLCSPPLSHPSAAFPSSCISEMSWKLPIYCQGFWGKVEDRLFTPLARCCFPLVMTACLKTKRA